MPPKLSGILRRQLLAAGLAAPWLPAAAQGAASMRRELQFPRDLGSHDDHAIEWWYLTGRLLSGAQEFGFQLTFFRSRVPGTQGMTSAFAARQLIFAHAAVTDVSGKKLWHDQRIARAGFGLAQASEHDTDVALRDWSLRRESAHYLARANSKNFRFQLDLTPAQGLLLQGDRGLSRKGPDQKSTSYYYSLPQLQANGSLTLSGQVMPVRGSAWLDHEWSQALAPAQAAGWDWIGINLSDGSALTAFQMRDKAGQALWHGGSFRTPVAGAAGRIFRTDEVQFQALRHWTSALTRASYPVEWRLQTPLASYTVKAVIDDQELDSRASTGAVYWEGLSELYDSQGRLVGRGYLEMTGYAGALRW